MAYKITEYTYKPITNADRIRGMSDEEMAQFLVRSVAKKCPPGDWNYDCGWDNSQFWAFWIRQPAEEASDGQTI